MRQVSQIDANDRSGRPTKPVFIERHVGPEELKLGDLPDPVASDGIRCLSDTTKQAKIPRQLDALGTRTATANQAYRWFTAYHRLPREARSNKSGSIVVNFSEKLFHFCELGQASTRLPPTTMQVLEERREQTL
jgi:hypothetical protein